MASGMGYLNKNYTNISAYDPSISQEILNDTAFLTARLFGGPVMMRDEIDPLIRSDVSSGTSGRYCIGRTTAQTIAVNPTIVSLAPGVAKFLPFGKGFGKTSLVKDAITGALGYADRQSLLSAVTGSASGSSWAGIKDNHIFYKFDTAYNDYINHVNMIARIMAIYLNIGDEEVPYCNKKFKEMDWAHYYDNEDPDAQNSDVKTSVIDEKEELSWNADEEEYMKKSSSAQKVFSYYGNEPEDTIFGPNSYIHFYTNSNTSYEESVSTNTRASSIQSMFEGVFEDSVKDIQFLFGGSTNEDGIIGDLTSLFSGLAENISNVSDITRSAANYLKGGRLVFPQMVDGTTYSKSLSLGIRFTSPYGDPISVFMYCLLPLAHIMAFSFPRQLDNNMYTYPFLVSAYSRGYCNVDMGVVTSIRVARGGQDDSSWSADGMATDIEVSLDITPLHSELMITSARHPFQFLANYGLQEYLGTICGVDMKGDTVRAQLDLIGTIFNNWVMDIIPNVIRGTQDYVLNSVIGQYAQGIMNFLRLP